MSGRVGAKTPEIEFADVSFSYGGSASGDGGAGGDLALREVTLRIEPGEFVAVIGANGSGKSTLAKHMNALLVPDSGVARVAGIDTRDAARVLEVRQRVGMVFQNPDSQTVASIVRDDVAFGPENLGLAPDEVRARVADALAAVDMAAHADDEVQTLSGGQKQLVAVAGVLAMHPEALVLDEPGAMLDVRGRAAVMNVARDLHAQGMTVVLVTHFMEDTLEADRVVVLNAGAVELEGTPPQVFADAARLRALGLELPFTARVAEGLRAHGIGVSVQAALDERCLADELVSMRKRLCGDELADGRFSASTEEAPEITGASSVPLIEFENVTFSYDEARGSSGEGAHAVLRDLSFAVRQGELLGIVGHTGSGKSTLVQLMDALLVPTGGRVVACGIDTSRRKRRREVRGRVGLVFQYPETQLFATSVAEDVAFGPRNLKLGRDEVERRVRDALARVGLDYDDVAEKSPFALSGGQQRRVAIAGVLAMEPRALVLDEPAAGLDPLGARQMRDLLHSLNDQGTTVVLVSHSMDEVAVLCDRVLVLDKGQLVALGTPGQVFSSEHTDELQQMGLGMPRASAFALELAERGLDLGGSVLTTEQLVAALCKQLDEGA